MKNISVIVEKAPWGKDVNVTVHFEKFADFNPNCEMMKIHSLVQTFERCLTKSSWNIACAFYFAYHIFMINFKINKVVQMWQDYGGYD